MNPRHAPSGSSRMLLTGHNLQRRRVLKDLNLSRPDIEEFSKEFKDQISLIKQVREQNNLDPNTFVPEVSHGRTCFALRAFCLRNQCEFTARRFAPVQRNWSSPSTS